MKIKTTKRFVSLFLALVMVFGLIPFSNVTAFAADTYDVEGNRIENEYLQFAANDEYYAMHTTGGNPALDSDDYQRLLYGSMGSGTSITVIRIGENDHIFNPDYTMLNSARDCVYSVETIGDIKIERYCSFVQNTETERKDTLEMKYVITNIGEDALEVGTRIMLDTMLGGNDDAPFRIYENHELVDVTYEREYVGDAIPQHWYVFDSLSSPTVLGSGTFYKNERERPDKVQFILWPTSNTSSFYNSVHGGGFGDSSVNVYYYPETIRAGASRTVSTYYGISEFTAVEGDEEAEIRLTNAIAPHALAAQEDEMDYQSNPFQFSAWISNTGDANSEDVTATLVLPDELTIDGQDAQISLGSISADSYKSVGWMIRALPQEVEKEVTYSVIVSVVGEEDLVYDFTVDLPALNPVHEHTPGEWVVATEATCTEEGVRNHLCAVCGEVIETETIAALGHTYDSIEISVPVTNDKVDIAFAIDTTGSMSDDISEVKRNMAAYLDALVAKGIDYRVAIVDYRDFASRTDASEDYPYKVELDFSNNATAIRNSINSLSLGNGGDTRETIYSALVDGLTSLHWRDDAGKAVIVMGDAGALDPEPYTGYTYEYVRSVLSGGTAPAGKTKFSTPVALFAIDSGSAYDPLEDLAEATGGEYYTVSTAPEISVIINRIITTITDTIYIPGSEWVTRREATCTEAGERYRTCTRCGYEDVRMIPALGHDFTEVIEVVEPTYTDEGYTVYGCSRHCGETERRDFTEILVSPATLIISNEVAKRNREVTVTLTLQDAIPIKSLMLYDFEYDESIMELIDVSFVCEGTAIENWNPSNGEAVMTFPENTDANGIVVELTFLVNDVDNVTSDINCSVRATFAREGSTDKLIPVTVVAGSVTVFSGDVNGDGVLNTLDVIYLLKHTLLPERYPLYCDADFDNDGYVTSNDAIYLLSHIMFPDRYPLGGR